MKRILYGEEHLMFRDAVRTFLDREVIPNQKAWNDAGIVARSAWRRAGEAGLLCPWMSEEWGGPGGDFLHSCIVNEEFARAYESGFAVGLHSDIVVPYIHDFGTKAQKEAWLPGCASGELITAIAMTEASAATMIFANLAMTALTVV